MTLLAALALLIVVVLAGLALFTWRTTRRIEAALPPNGRFVDVPGARLHVLERGQGQPVVLVHGLSGQLGNYDYGMIAPLARDFRVVAYDRPGAGYSTREPGAPADLPAQAAALAALIDKLGLERPLVVGHSLGGAVALALAIAHPEKVGGLALVAPLTHPPSKVSTVFSALAIRQPWLRRLVAWTLALPMSIARRKVVLDIVFGPEAMPEDFPVRGGGLLGMRPSHFIGASEDLNGVAHSLEPLLSRYAGLHLPVSILYGRGDRILDPAENGEALAAKVPGARLTLMDGGHMLPVTAPEATVAFVREAAARLHKAEATPA